MQDQYKRLMGRWSELVFREKFDLITAFIRILRLLEETMELAQAEGVTREEAITIINQVWDKEPGDKFQELGGVMTTLMGYANTADVDLDEAFMVEFLRIMHPDVMEKVRKRNLEGDKIGFKRANPIITDILTMTSFDPITMDMSPYVPGFEFRAIGKLVRYDETDTTAGYSIGMIESEGDDYIIEFDDGTKTVIHDPDGLIHYHRIGETIEVGLRVSDGEDRLDVTYTRKDYDGHPSVSSLAEWATATVLPGDLVVFKGKLIVFNDVPTIVFVHPTPQGYWFPVSKSTTKLDGFIDQKVEVLVTMRSNGVEVERIRLWDEPDQSTKS